MNKRTDRQTQTNRQMDGRVRFRNHELSRLERDEDSGGGGRALTSISWFDGGFQESFGRLAVLNMDVGKVNLKVRFIGRGRDKMTRATLDVLEIAKDISSLEPRVDREGENANAIFEFCENSKRDDTGKLLGRPRSPGIILR